MTLRIEATPIHGAFIVHSVAAADERGIFARLWCRDELDRAGLEVELAQCSLSFNRLRGTVRGMHYQASPHEEVKLVHCLHGAIYDVVIDLRPDSDTYGKWFGLTLEGPSVELAEHPEGTHRALYIPEGCAHGFQTLVDRTTVGYWISHPYVAEFSRGVRWNDPAFGIDWPLAPTVISTRDQQFPDHSHGKDG